MKYCDCNIYDTTAALASPLECGPGKTNTRVLDSGKNREIPRRVLMRTFLFQKEICLDIGVENLARGIVHPTSALLDSGAVDDENCC
ncbi:hypothetical protein SERLADRAFT_443876 [Serpula lacrymans var. lacrymans S7.9]|uniref:Uncharacterized protein n=1 Tax=Serpula lacrymans var. lacrymans (strain S7.9) TaxID=578457 RepID=F8PDT9_SERL9|nr:uncharacterized protein SERLADRAFT_443876 [Serpula lacrymans var. lacrymans S7.9]EGO18536.1 hypothetical protein SERLADRAFT_443876 [Serpula lacrymans var. lacrymans S7.9]